MEGVAHEPQRKDRPRTLAPGQHRTDTGAVLASLGSRTGGSWSRECRSRCLGNRRMGRAVRWAVSYQRCRIRHLPLRFERVRHCHQRLEVLRWRRDELKITMTYHNVKILIGAWLICTIALTIVSLLPPLTVGSVVAWGTLFLNKFFTSAYLTAIWGTGMLLLSVFVILVSSDRPR